MSTFFDAVFAGISDDYYVNSFYLPSRKSKWHRPSEMPEEWPQDRDVYYGMGLAKKSYGPHNRIEASEVAAITCLWLDADYGPNHKKAVPPDEATTGKLIRDCGLHPSLAVHSGNGLHVLWLLDEPILITTPEDRKAAANLVKAWQAHIRAIFKAAGYDLDATHDLSRVLRVPGTKNWKDPDNPKEVKLIFGDLNNVVRYSQSQFTAIARVVPPTLKGQRTQQQIEPAIKLSRNTYPERKFNALLANSETFEDTWNQQRTDLSDTSPSGYDLALANIAVAAGWKDAEIHGLMLAWRRKHAYDTDKLLRTDYVTGTIVKARESSSGGEHVPACCISEGPFGVTLTVSTLPRQTVTKMTITGTFTRAENEPIELMFSTSATSLNATAADIAAILFDALPEEETRTSLKTKIKGWMTRAIPQIRRWAAQKRRQEPSGQTMLDIIIDRVRVEYDLRFSDNLGQIWSERKGRWIKRQEVIGYTPKDMLAQLTEACDVPTESAGEPASDARLASVATKLLGIAWATITAELPSQENASGLTDATNAAALLRAAIIKAWTVISTGRHVEVTAPGGDTQMVPARCSLASKVREKEGTDERYWQEVQGGYHAYRRPGVFHERLTKWLAMRFELFAQVNVILPGVNTPTKFTQLAKAYGLAADDGDPDTPPFYLSGGKARVVVLSPELSAEILAIPIDDPSDQDPQSVTDEEGDDPDTPQGVTEKSAGEDGLLRSELPKSYESVTGLTTGDTR